VVAAGSMVAAGSVVVVAAGGADCSEAVAATRRRRSVSATRPKGSAADEGDAARTIAWDAEPVGEPARVSGSAARPAGSGASPASERPGVRNKEKRDMLESRAEQSRGAEQNRREQEQR
jgi:hypothetical protein